MKKTAYFVGLCILFIGYFSLSTMAQEAEMPENFAVFEEMVSPADMVEFVKVQNKTIEQWDKHNIDLTFWTYRTDDNTFYWVLPIKNFASMDEIFAKSSALQKKMKDDGYNAAKEFRDLSTGRQSIIHWDRELSYHPDGEFGQTTGNSFCEWSFIYLKAGHEKEAAEAVKKYINFYDGIDETYSWDVYKVMMGHDTPCWIVMFRGESEVAVRQHEAKLQEKYGQDFQKLWGDFAQHIRKVENKKGWFLPKWSRNIPE